MDASQIYKKKTNKKLSGSYGTTRFHTDAFLVAYSCYLFLVEIVQTSKHCNGEEILLGKIYYMETRHISITHHIFMKYIAKLYVCNLKLELNIQYNNYY